MIHRILPVLVLASCAPDTTAGALLAAANTPAPSRAIAIVADTSDSMNDGRGSVCRAVRGVADQEIQSPGLGSRSTLQVWTTAPDGSAGGGVRIVEPTLIPKGGSALESDRRLEAKRTEFLDRIQAECEKSAAQTHTSPVFNAADAAARSLNAELRLGDTGSLWLLSDLQENGYRPIQDRISPPRKPTKEPLAGISASRLTVRACGYSRTSGTLTGKLDPDVLLRTETVWREVFQGETRFDMEPACPMARENPK